MKSRSEVKAEKKDVPAPESEPAVAGVPEMPFDFQTANANRKTKVRSDLEKIVESTFVNDLHSSWEKLRLALKLGEKRSDHSALHKALDEAEENAHLAHRVFVTAKLERERWERENDVVWGAMWSEATKSLQKEKEEGLRAKQVTDADIKARVATLYPDEYVEIEVRRAKIKATVDTLENLSDAWGSRCRSLGIMKSSLRG
jgi:hypothetical protein